MKWFDGSIRTRMIAWVLAVTGMILVVVIVVSYRGSRRRLELEMENKAFLLADGAARRIDAQLGVLQGVVHGMALALEAQRLEIPFEEVREMQTSCIRDYEGIYGVCIALEPGLAPSGWPDLAAYEHCMGDRMQYADLSGPDHAHTREDWFTLPKYLERPVWSEPYDWDGILMVTYSVPIYLDQGAERRFAGVVTCDLTIDWLERIIAELPLGEGGYGLLMSRSGTYVSHPLPELVLNETVFSVAEERNDPELREIGRQMVSGRPDIMPFVSFLTGDLSWLAFTPLRSTEWIMAALISREEMNAEILRLSRGQAGIGFAGLLLLSFAVALIARSIARPVRELSDAADTLAGGNLDALLPASRGRDEVAHLTHAFSEMRDNLKRYVADLRETTAARERMNSELRIGRDIQMGLVPKTFPPFPGRKDIDIFAVIEPAREVGGDFYDFFLLDENRMVLAIGDVSGKGVPAALFMAVTRSFLRSEFRSDSDPALVLQRVNEELVDGNESCMFVTLFCAVLDLSSGCLCYANAGHNPPVIRRPDGGIEWITEPHGPVAGPMPGSSYVSGTMFLTNKAPLILYTDGVTEAMNAEGDLYGEERMAKRIGEMDETLDCRTLIEGLVADVRAFASGFEQSDDITILALTWISDEAGVALATG